MAVRGLELGLRRQASRRVGAQGDIPRFGGVAREGNPGNVPPNRFWRLVNTRFVPTGGLKSRQTVEYFNRSAVIHSSAAVINSLYDFQTTVLRRLYLLVRGCVGISPTVGASLMWFDHDQSPIMQRGVYYSTASSLPYFAAFDGFLHIGLDTALGKFATINPPYGVEGIAGSGSTQNQPIATFAGFAVKNMKTFDSKLFVALDAGAGASKIATWDGLAIRDDLTGINAPTQLGLWRNLLVLGFGSATNHIRTRVAGSSPGTWTTVAPGAGTVATEQMVSYKDNLYITDAAANVWKYDGTTLAIVRTVVGATMYGIESYEGYLYYSYETAANRARIGRYDGSSFTDNHKDLTTQVGTIKTPRRLRRYRGDLYVSVDHTVVSGLGSELLRSPGSTTSGTWTRYNLGASAANGIDDMGAF